MKASKEGTLPVSLAFYVLINLTFLSEYANQLIKDMQNKSVYLQPVLRESRTTSALPLPGAVLTDGVVHSILDPSSPVHLTTQIFRLISITASIGLSLWPADKLVTKLNPYFLKSLTYSKLSVISNWFSKFEARCLFWLLMACKEGQNFGTQFLALSIRVCGLIHSPDDILVRDLLELIVFNKSLLKSEVLLADYLSRVGVHNVQPLSSASNIGTIETSLVKSIEKSKENIEDIKKMYLEKLLKDAHCRHSLAIHSCDNSGIQVMTFSCETVLSQDWQYFPLLETYSMEQNNKKTDTECIPAVRNCLSWLLISNTSTEQSSKADVTAEYCRLATVFLAGNDFFLDPEVHVLLSTLLNEILSVGCLPDMSMKVPGITSCHDFYIQLLNQFQAVSYGDQLFAIFICLPLAMSQPSQFRKSLWMERQEVVRAITLKNEHFEKKILNAFLDPIETELEVVVAYYQCLNLGYARKNVQSFLYHFAVHHIKHFIRLSTNEPERLKFIQYVKNSAKGDLKYDLEI